MGKRKHNHTEQPSTALHHDLIVLTHGKPRTRRQFLTSGVISSMAYVSTPSILSMLVASEARGDGCAESESNHSIPFLAIELAGGANIPGSNVMVGQAGNQTNFLTGGYPSLGLTASPSAINSAFGLAFHNQSPMLGGLLAATTPAVQAKTEGAIFCHTSVDDIATSLLNPTYAIQLAGASGSLSPLIGTRATDSGGAMPTPANFFNPALRPTRILVPQDGVNLVNLGAIADELGNDAIKKILHATEQMSSAQLRRFSAQDLPAQVKELALCGYIKPQDNLTKFSKQAVDASIDPNITAHFNMANPDQRRLGTMVKLLADGYAGAATYLIGANDYHDGTRTTGNARDRRNGDLIGRALSAFAAKQKPVVIYVFTDGGIASANGNTWVADSGDRSSSFMLVYNPTARVGLRTPSRRQVGQFNNLGSVDSSYSKINESDANVVKAVTANYLALQGREGELRQLLGDDPFGREGLEEVLIFDKMA